MTTASHLRSARRYCIKIYRTTHFEHLILNKTPSYSGDIRYDYSFEVIFVCMKFSWEYAVLMRPYWSPHHRIVQSSDEKKTKRRMQLKKKKKTVLVIDIFTRNKRKIRKKINMKRKKETRSTAVVRTARSAVRIPSIAGSRVPSPSASDITSQTTRRRRRPGSGSSPTDLTIQARLRVCACSCPG